MNKIILAIKKFILRVRIAGCYSKMSRLDAKRERIHRRFSNRIATEKQVGKADFDKISFKTNEIHKKIMSEIDKKFVLKEELSRVS